jgi:outer membrane protein OmpA-like peptidoglycan-associated protein
MMKKRRSIVRLDSPWLAYTDLLSSTLMIVTLALVVSALAKFVNQKPPIIRLSDEADFRFATGSYSLSQNFKNQLVNEKLPDIENTIRCYGIDTVEVIGHTDFAPNGGTSNIDSFQGDKNLILSGKAVSGSNADLGLLRALSVERFLETSLKPRFPNIDFFSYSASSYVDPADLSSMKSKSSQISKRRIEIRFTRSDKSAAIPRC